MNESLPIVVANLKANKTWDEVASWIDDVAQTAVSFAGTIIFCPSHPFLAASFAKISQNGINLKLGAQDISRFNQGAYTGEVAASQIADLVKYAIIGHSERRQNFREDNQTLAQKVANAKLVDIEPVFCIGGAETPIPQNVSIVAYEPVFAIGTGNPDTSENVKKVASQIKTKGNFTVIYGGSVSAENIKLFLAKGVIDGVLVGATNSLDLQKFTQILMAAS